MLKKIYYKFFPTYRVLETRFVNYQIGNELIIQSIDKIESEKWVLAPEEDNNKSFGMVYLCRKQRM
jgi:hypothetical protein